MQNIESSYHVDIYDNRRTRRYVYSVVKIILRKTICIAVFGIVLIYFCTLNLLSENSILFLGILLLNFGSSGKFTCPIAVQPKQTSAFPWMNFACLGQGGKR